MKVIVGIESLNAKLDKLAKPQLEQAFAKACAVVEEKAKLNAPSGDTGDLRNSITSEHDDREGRIGTNLPYAPFVHQGTGIHARNGDGRQGY